MADNYSSFDSWALTYDDDMRKAYDSDDWIFRGYYRILGKVIEYCELDKYENPFVLDIGSGTGNLSARFLEKGLIVTAIDPSETMREICKSKYPNMDVLQGDFLDVPFPPQSIDIIVSSYAFHHLTPDEKETSISIMKKLLKPKGRIVIADLMFKNLAEKKRIIQELIDSGRSEMVEDIEDEYPAYFENLEQVFRKNGFSLLSEQLTESIWILCACL